MISYKDKSTWLAVVWDTIHQLEVVEDARWDTYAQLWLGSRRARS
jgi:hypothetical protein